MLDGHGILGAVEIAFFAPTLILGIIICVRHGFSRRLGWISLVILSLLRLIGSACLLYAEVNNDDNYNLLAAYYVCNSIGTVTLLFALTGYLTRINDGMQHMGVAPKVFRVIGLVAIVSIVLAIVGGSFQGDSDPSSVNTGHDLGEAASCLFVALFLILAGITILSFLRISHVRSIERKLLYAALASLPFLLVRVVYAIAVSFSHDPSSPLYAYNVNIYIAAFMQFLMEAIVVIIYVTAGLVTPEAPKVEEAKEGQALEPAARV